MRRKDRQVTDHRAIEEILKECKTCRLAMVDKGQPYVVALSYGYTLESGKLTLVFHSAHEGRKISILKENSAVCFEISCEGEASFSEKTACDYGYYYRSVIGFGNAGFVEEYEEKAKALTLITEHQAGVKAEFTIKQTNTVAVLKVQTTDFSGKMKVMERT